MKLIAKKINRLIRREWKVGPFTSFLRIVEFFFLFSFVRLIKRLKNVHVGFVKMFQLFNFNIFLSIKLQIWTNIK